MPDLEFLITEPIFVTGYGDPIDDPRVLVTDADRTCAVILTADKGTVFVNGEFYDFGDDFPAILAIFDEVLALGPGEHRLDADEIDGPVGAPMGPADLS